MHLARQALGNQHRRLYTANVCREVAVQGINATLAASAPEELRDAEAHAGRDAVDRTCGERDRVGEEDRVGVEDGGEFVVLPQRIDLGEVGQVEAARLE